MPVLAIHDKKPKIDPSAWIAGSAEIIGDVEIGAQSSVWFGTVIRGDVDYIRIGERTNIQDLSVVHVTNARYPTVVGSDVTVGHRVTLHGCTVKDRVLVGIGAILLDGVVVESDSLIAAGSLLAPGTIVPSGVLMMGSPAKPKRELRPSERNFILESARNYVNYQRLYG